VAARQLGFKRFVGIGIEAGDTLFSGFELGQKLRKLAIARGTANEAHPGRAMKNLFAFLLGDAAKDTNFLGLSGHFAKFAQAGKDFLRCFFADAAGVIEDKGCSFDGIDLAIAARKKHAGNFFGIVFIHLAAKGFEIERAALGRVYEEIGFRRGGEPAADERIEADIECFLHGTTGILAHGVSNSCRMPASRKRNEKMEHRGRRGWSPEVTERQLRTPGVLTEGRMYAIRKADLPLIGSSYNFVGADHQNVAVSVYLAEMEPGRGAPLHIHEYDEVLIT